MRSPDFAAILDEAHAAARAAQSGLREPNNPPRLPCGFAWVTIDGNEPLARFCRKHSREGIGAVDTRRHYGTKGSTGKGWQWWKPGDYGGQSVHVHEVGAAAFRNVLACYGIRSDLGSRLD